MSRASRPMPGSSSTRCRNPRSISSRAFPRPSPSSSATPPPIPARQSPQPPRFTITFGSSSPPTGQPHDPATGAPVFKLSAQQIADQVEAYPAGLEDHHPRALSSAPRRANSGTSSSGSSARDSFGRGSTARSSRSATDPIKLDKARPHSIEIVVDRLVVRRGRAHPPCRFHRHGAQVGRFPAPGAAPEPGPAGAHGRNSSTRRISAIPRRSSPCRSSRPKHFSFNSHLGACPACHGLGTESFFDCDLMIPDPRRPWPEGAIAPWQPHRQADAALLRRNPSRPGRPLPGARSMSPTRISLPLSRTRSVSGPARIRSTSSGAKERKPPVPSGHSRVLSPRCSGFSMTPKAN